MGYCGVRGSGLAASLSGSSLRWVQVVPKPVRERPECPPVVSDQHAQQFHGLVNVLAVVPLPRLQGAVVHQHDWRLLSPAGGFELGHNLLQHGRSGAPGVIGRIDGPAGELYTAFGRELSRHADLALPQGGRHN